MPFRSKNVYHLRLTSQEVLPLYVYLDDRHLDWMTRATLNAVVSDLRPLVGPKLEAEKNAHFGPGGPASATRPTVQVFRGNGYQFAYFLRKAEPHAVVLKTRNYTLPSPKPKLEHERAATAAPLQASHADGKRKRSAAADSPSAEVRKRPRNRGGSTGKGRQKTVEVVADSEEEEADAGGDEESPLSELDPEEADEQAGRALRRRSGRSRKQVAHGYREESDGEHLSDTDMQDEEYRPTAEDEAPAPRGGGPSSAMMVEDEEEEEKPKPVMQLSFRSLKMLDRCLCVVVEPWPPLTVSAASRASSIAPRAEARRVPSIAPPDFVPSIPERDETPAPLFFPDFDRRSATPAPVRFSSVLSSLQTMDGADDSADAEDDFGMLAFSQLLNSVAGESTVGVEEDDEIDGSVLYGDADEMRSIIQ